jgi:hypothetical protein
MVDLICTTEAHQTKSKNMLIPVQSRDSRYVGTMPSCSSANRLPVRPMPHYVICNAQHAVGIANIVGALIAGSAGDHMHALRFAIFQMVLTGEFQRGFCGFRAGAEEHYAPFTSAFRCAGNQVVGGFFGGFIGEQAGVGVGHTLHLAGHGGAHRFVVMANAQDSGTTTYV